MRKEGPCGKMSVIDEIKERLDIIDVISGYVSLKKAGHNYKGLCPFHAEKTPSFVVFPDSQSWHCFGACGTGGDIFAFIMRHDNLDFSAALAVLAQRAGIELKPKTDEQKREEDLQQRLLAIHKLATAYFHNRLLTAPDAQAARDYLIQRGLNQETIARFSLGYAPDDWQALGHYLNGKGYSDSDLLASGLVIARESGSGHYDRFRNRVIIPIRDHSGHPIGFGGRVLDDAQPKYLNSPETPLFEKGHVLFGLDLAKATIRAEDVTIVVEGYMDVIQAHQHGITNVVAAMGTALTETQVKTLRRYAQTIVLALDPDTAGSQATLRGLDLSRQVTLHEVIQIGTAVVESQYSSEADVRIAVLPPGQDPDDLIREEPETWAGIIENALPVIDYYFQLMQGQFDLSTARGKSDAAEQLLPVLRDIENPIQRAHYIGKLARLLHVDEKTIQEQLRGHRRRKLGQAEAWQSVQDVHLRRPVFEVEEHCLMVLLQWPHSLLIANQVLADIGMSAIEADDFLSVKNQQIFLAMSRLFAQTEELASETLQANLDDSLVDHLERLLAYWKTLPPIPDNQAENEAIRSILKLRQQVIGRWLKELHALQADAETEGDAVSAESYGLLVRTYAQQKNLLQQLIHARTVAKQVELLTRHRAITVSGK